MWPDPCSVIYLSGSKIQGIFKKYSENFADYFHPSKNGMTGPVSKPFVEKNSICC